jgi:deoxycytidylate deaminase
LFWPGKLDARDHVLGYDSNEMQRKEIVEDILERLRPDGVDPDRWKKDGRARLAGASVMDITEYGHPVHAEMEAILSCGRVGVSARGGTLYSTTFPCHNCAKHILDAGIERVVYVEPYPKSKTATSTRIRSSSALSSKARRSWPSRPSKGSVRVVSSTSFPSDRAQVTL